MSKKMLIDAIHPEETRVVVAEGNRVEEFDFETENRLRLAGNIYLAKVTRVEPALQAAFIEYGGSRHGFLPFSEIHPDYYQIPVADRQALLAEEEAFDRMQAESEVSGRESERPPKGRPFTKAEAVRTKDALQTEGGPSDEIPGMGVVDLDADPDPAGDAQPMEASEPVTDTKANVQIADESGTTPQSVTESGTVSPEEETGRTGGDESVDHGHRIESLAGDEAEEIRQSRRPRQRPYKIQEVIKVRQILLVQVIKEERGNKGAALTTYISLAGRFCVLMPNTARGGGISRKITNAPDRNKLKEIASNLSLPKGAGLIIRTAGANRTKSEIKRDYEFLLRLWEQIRELTLNSIAPVQIYEEGNLIKRSIRDLYSREIEEVLVEGATGYKTAKDFMKMIMPSHAKRVKSYQGSLPLFSKHQVESHLSSMYSPTVHLKSGGYIVIGVTEALVAIDVNSGRATREGSVEGTALKTNLEAAEEIARQIRLRDLAGLIVIDFIDMDERRNNAAVEKRFKSRLRTDRARIQVGSISGFGLLEMSRQRQRLGMIEATTQSCPACHGTGRVRSDENLALGVLRQLEEEGARRRYREFTLRAPVGLVNFLINRKREHIAEIEGRFGVSIQVEADAAIISPDYVIERSRTATRSLRRSGSVISVDPSMMPELEEEAEDTEVAEKEVQPEEPRPKTRRRNRRKRSGSGSVKTSDGMTDAGTGQGEAEAGAERTRGDSAQGEISSESSKSGERSSGRRRARSSKSESTAEPAADAQVDQPDVQDTPDASVQTPEKKPRKSRRRRSDRTATKASEQVQSADADGDSVSVPKATPDSGNLTELDATVSSDVSEAPVLLSDSDSSTGQETVESSKVAELNLGAVGDQGGQAMDSEADPCDQQMASQPSPKRRGWWSAKE